LLTLYVEFKTADCAIDPTDASKGTDAEFARKIQVAKASFSSMKSGSRQIGDKLARQFESICGKSTGWMDDLHEVGEGLEDSDRQKNFLKLAKRAFARASTSEQDRLLDVVMLSLKGEAKSV